MPTPSEAYVNSVQRQGTTGARLRPANFGAAGETLGRAAQGFGQDLQQVAKNVDEIAERYDVAAAKSADAEDALKITEIHARTKTKTGFEAQQAVTDGRAEIAKIREARMASLNSPRQRAMYDDVFNKRMEQIEESFTTHSIKQVDVAERGASLARAETGVTTAVDSYDNPEMFNKNLQTAQADFAAAHRGEGEDVIRLGQAKLVSMTHRKVVESLLASPDKIDAANDWVTQNAKDIIPDDEVAIRRALNPLLDEQEGDADLGQILSHGKDYYSAVPPEDGQPDPLAPTPAVPRRQGEPIKDVISHVVSGRGRVSNTAAQHRARGSNNALDIAAPEGTPIRPPMSGRVLKSWTDTEHGGGHSALIQHPNGMVTGYAHMRAPSALSVGDEVDSTTIIGGVGSTGKSTGNHLHFTVRNAGGVKLDPQSVNWAAVAGSGGPTLVNPRTAQWKEGALPEYTADKNQLGELLARAHEVATLNNWSPRRYERAVKRIREYAGISEQVYNAQYDDLKDSVWSRISDLDGGDGLTSISQLGAGYGSLRGQDRLTVTNLIAENKRRVAAGEDAEAKANSAYYAQVALMGYSDSPSERAAFLGMKFEADPNISRAERTRLQLRQQTMRQETGATNHGTIRAHINRYNKPAGIVEEKGANKKALEQNRIRRVILFDTVNAEVREAQKKKGTPLSDDDIDGIVRRQVTSIARQDESGKGIVSGPLYLMQRVPKAAGTKDVVTVSGVYESMSQATRDSIIRGIRSGGGAVTKENIVRIYLERRRS